MSYAPTSTRCSRRIAEDSARTPSTAWSSPEPFDLTIGLVGHLHTLGQRSGTVQLSMHFLRPVLGDRFEVLGRVVRAGRSLVFAAAELHDENGKLCARCDGIVAVAREPAAEMDETIAL